MARPSDPRSNGVDREQMPTGAQDLLFHGLLEPWILLTIKQAPCHGYGLIERLRGDGIPVPHITTVYRHLGRLEEREALESTWLLREGSAPTRVYRLTPRGEALLDSWYRAVSLLDDLTRRFYAQYELAASREGE